MSTSTVIPISPDRAIFDLPTIGSAQISPDGTRIVWVRSQANRETHKNESQIWLANADGSAARQLTQVGTGNSEPIWSPDGSAIAYVSRRDGDHPAAIALLSFDGGESRILTTHNSSPSNLAWSPDGSTIAYIKAVDPQNPNETPRDPKAPAAVRVVKRIDYKQDGFGYLNDVRTQLFLLDVASGERRQETQELVDHVKPQWSPDGKTIALGLPHLNGMRSRFGLLTVESGELAVHGDLGGAIGIAAWSPDGSRIIFAAQQHGSPQSDLTIFDVEAGTFQKVLDNPEFVVDGGLATNGAPIWLDETNVVIHTVLHGRSALLKVDTGTGASTEVGDWDAIHVGLSTDSAGSTVVQAATDLNGFVGVVAVDLATGNRTTVVDEGADFVSENAAAQWELVQIDRDGTPIEGWLLKPADFDPAKRYPVVIEIHGGPHGYFSFAWNNHAEMLATNGFCVLISNPRGSTSYGRDFAEAVHNDWGGEDWKDLQAILDHVVARPYIDGDRSGVYGYSYGGYMTSWAIGHTDRFKAAIVGAPCFDLESFFGTSDIGHFFGPYQTGGTPWENREKMAAQSPSTFIHNAVTPTLIVHGEADERCPIGQGEQLFISLKKLGVETEFARYPGGFHGFVVSGDPSLRLDYYERTLGWFKKYLGDPA